MNLGFLIASILYGIGLLVALSVWGFLVVLGGGCRFKEGVEIILSSFLWPLAIPFYTIKFLFFH